MQRKEGFNEGRAVLRMCALSWTESDYKERGRRVKKESA
jgi:hypothetical protein